MDMASIREVCPCDHNYMLFEVGKDVFGSSNVDNLKSFGVNTKYIDVSESEKTGCATVIVTKEGTCKLQCQLLIRPYLLT